MNAYLFLNTFYLFIYFWLCWVFVAGCRLSLVAVSRGYSLVGKHRLLTAVASLVAEHGLEGSQASVTVVPRLWSTGSVAVAHSHPTA